MVTVADPEEFGFAVETAVTFTGAVVTLPFAVEVVGTPPGATNRPEVEINPVAWLPPATPLTSQVTAVLVTPFTAAVNCWVVKIDTVAGLGLTVTATCCAMVTLAEPESELFADKTAVTVTVAGLGMVPGAVYKPLEVMVPDAAPPPGVPFTCHVTEVFVVPVTVAMNCVVAPGLSVAVAGVTVTVIGGGGDEPQDWRNREAAAVTTKNGTERMRSLILTTHASIENFRTVMLFHFE